MKAMLGCAIALSTRCLVLISMGTSVAPAVSSRVRRAVEAPHVTAVQLPQEVGDISRDEIDQRRRRAERLLFGKGATLVDGGLRERHIPLPAGRQRAHVGGQVGRGLLRRGLVHLFAAAGHRVRGANVGPRRHRRHVGRDRQNEAGRCGARAWRRDEHGHRRLRRQHAGHDVASGIDQTARRRQGEDDERGASLVSEIERLDHVLGRHGMNDAVDVRDVDGRRRRGRQGLVGGDRGQPGGRTEPEGGR